MITFDHHPDEILTGTAPPLLCDPQERLALLEAAGVDTTVVVHFDRRLRETPYEAFVAAIADRAPIAGFLMTPDAAFGFERAGTPEALAALGEREGFDVVVVPPFELGGAAVRSSDVRRGDRGRRPRTGDRAPGPAARGQWDHRRWRKRRAVVRFGVPVALPPPGTYEVGRHAGGRADRSPGTSRERGSGRAPRGVDPHVRPGRVPRCRVDPAGRGM